MHISEGILSTGIEQATRLHLGEHCLKLVQVTISLLEKLG